jgi:hypothetical protein
VLLPLSTDGMDVRPQGSEEEAEAAETSLLQATQQLQDQLEEVRAQAWLVLTDLSHGSCGAWVQLRQCMSRSAVYRSLQLTQQKAQRQADQANPSCTVLQCASHV